MSDGNGSLAPLESPETLAEVRALEADFRALQSDIMLARATFMRQAGVTFGGNRDEYEILGYDRLVTNKQYRDEYARGGIAGRIVDVMPDACWRGDPAMELVEDEDPNTDTAFEQAWKELDTRLQICAKLQRTDRLARLSTYAVLLIGAPGNLDEELPRGNPDKLLYLMPFSGGGGPGSNADARMLSIDASCTIAEYDIDTQSERFGLPQRYQLKRTDFASPEFQRPVHHSRVIHVAEGLLEDDVFGQPALERVWNLLIDLRKVTGGGAEAFWLRANQGLHIDVDKDLALDKGQYADVVEKLKAQSELYKHQLTRWLQTRGVNVQTLGSDVANFANPADAVMTQIAGSKAIPKRILTGSEMGELASSQDRENFKDQINGRQTQYCGPVIVRQFADRLIKYGYLPTPRKGVLAYQVKWPHIQTLTEQEKSAGAKQWADTVVDGKPVFTDAEIRDKWYGYEPLTPEQLKAYYDRKVQDAQTQAKTMKLTQPPQAPAPFVKAAEAGDEELIRVLADAIDLGATDVVAKIVGLPIKTAGGPGSGNRGHAGRPGEVGGSSHGDWPIGDDVVRNVGSNYPAEVDRASAQWRDGLTDSQKQAFQIYVNGSKRINNPLRGVEEADANTSRMIQDIQSALQQAPSAPPPDLVWRIVETARLPTLHEGDEIKLKGFQSTTLLPDLLPSLSGRSDRRLLEIKPRRGAYLGAAGQYTSQHEYLLDHDSRFRVRGEKTIKIQSRGGDTLTRKVIQLEML